MTTTFSAQAISLTFPPLTEGHGDEGSVSLHTALENATAKSEGTGKGLAHGAGKHPWAPKHYPFNTTSSVRLHAMPSRWVLLFLTFLECWVEVCLIPNMHMRCRAEGKVPNPDRSAGEASHTGTSTGEVAHTGTPAGEAANTGTSTEEATHTGIHTGEAVHTGTYAGETAYTGTPAGEVVHTDTPAGEAAHTGTHWRDHANRHTLWRGCTHSFRPSSYLLGII